jgi:hypothetical protein
VALRLRRRGCDPKNNDRTRQPPGLTKCSLPAVEPPPKACSSNLRCSERSRVFKKMYTQPAAFPAQPCSASAAGGHNGMLTQPAASPAQPSSASTTSHNNGRFTLAQQGDAFRLPHPRRQPHCASLFPSHCALTFVLSLPCPCPFSSHLHRLFIFLSRFLLYIHNTQSANGSKGNCGTSCHSSRKMARSKPTIMAPPQPGPATSGLASSLVCPDAHSKARGIGLVPS